MGLVLQLLESRHSLPTLLPGDSHLGADIRMMEVATYSHEDGELLCKLEIEKSTTFSLLRDKIEEEKGIDAEDQTLFLRQAAADSVSEVFEIRLEEDALDNWLVSDFKECRILVDIPRAADKVQTDVARLIIVGAHNKPWNLKQDRPVQLPSSRKLNILEEDGTKEENGRTFHQVLQYKDERKGTLSIETDGSISNVFYVSEDGVKDPKPLVPDMKDLEEGERRNWKQTGENIKDVVRFVGEVTTMVSKTIVTVSSDIAKLIPGAIVAILSLLRSSGGASQDPPASLEAQ